MQINNIIGQLFEIKTIENNSNIKKQKSKYILIFSRNIYHFIIKLN